MICVCINCLWTRLMWTNIWTCIDVFSNKRVVIAVTQFDKTFSPVEHNQMSEEDAKGIVCDMIESSTGVKASQDLVVPVCSLWAFVARKFRHSQGDNNLRHYTVSELGKCPRGQQEIPERLKPAILANRLEAKSGIDILEERLGLNKQVNSLQSISSVIHFRQPRRWILHCVLIVQTKVPVNWMQKKCCAEFDSNAKWTEKNTFPDFGRIFVLTIILSLYFKLLILHEFQFCATKALFGLHKADHLNITILTHRHCYLCPFYSPVLDGETVVLYLRSYLCRIRGMTGACAEIWAIAMTKNYCSYLGGAMEGVEKLLDSTRKTFQGSC